MSEILESITLMLPAEKVKAATISFYQTWKDIEDDDGNMKIHPGFLAYAEKFNSAIVSYEARKVLRRNLKPSSRSMNFGENTTKTILTGYVNEAEDKLKDDGVTTIIKHFKDTSTLFKQPSSHFMDDANYTKRFSRIECQHDCRQRLYFYNSSYDPNGERDLALILDVKCELCVLDERNAGYFSAQTIERVRNGKKKRPKKASASASPNNKKTSILPKKRGPKPKIKKVRKVYHKNSFIPTKSSLPLNSPSEKYIKILFERIPNTKRYNVKIQNSTNMKIIKERTVELTELLKKFFSQKETEVPQVSSACTSSDLEDSSLPVNFCEVLMSSPKSEVDELIKRHEKEKKEWEEEKAELLKKIPLEKDLKDFVQHDESFKDLTLKVEEKEIKVHKFLLAARSSTFKELLGNNPEAEFLTVSNISSATFEKVLRFLYADEFPIDGNFSELLAAANRLNIEELKEFAAKKLPEEVNSENALNMLKLSNKYGLEELKKAAFQEIKRKYPGINFKDEWANSIAKIMKVIDFFTTLESSED